MKLKYKLLIQSFHFYLMGESGKQMDLVRSLVQFSTSIEWLGKRCRIR